MGLWNLTFLSYGTLKRGHISLFSTGQGFCQKILNRIVAMIVLKRFCIVTHFCAAPFSIKMPFFVKLATFFTYSLENQIRDKTK